MVHMILKWSQSDQQFESHYQIMTGAEVSSNPARRISQDM